MSLFTVALNEVLDRMKDDEGITRLKFAQRIGMNVSTLHNYTTGRRVSDESALCAIANGLRKEDAVRILRAHALDGIPEQWRSQVGFDGAPANPQAFTLDDHPYLSVEFRRKMKLLLAEAKDNDHLRDLVDDLVALLGLEESPEADLPTWLPANIPHQPVPAGIVLSPKKPKAPPGRSTPSSPHSLSEEPPKADPQMTRTRRKLRDLGERERGSDGSPA